jgi:hypothetical protein
VFAWRYLSGDDREVGSSERFADRNSAEAWLGEAWADLAGEGVEQVELVDEGRGVRVYRMSLRAE